MSRASGPRPRKASLFHDPAPRHRLRRAARHRVDCHGGGQQPASRVSAPSRRLAPRVWPDAASRRRRTAARSSSSSVTPPSACRSRRGSPAARAAAAAPRHPATPGAGRPDPDHPRRRRRGRDARGRLEPGARLRHRRRGRAGAVPRQDRGPQGRRRHAVDARGRPCVRRRAVDARHLRDGVHDGVLWVVESFEPKAQAAVHAEGEGQGSGGAQAEARALLCASRSSSNCGPSTEESSATRCGCRSKEDRSPVERASSSSTRRTRPASSGRRRKKRRVRNAGLPVVAELQRDAEVVLAQRAHRVLQIVFRRAR